MLKYLIALIALTNLSSASPHGKRASCTVSSIDDASDLSDCSSVTINAFTVPAGETFTLNLADGATVNLDGDVLFGNLSWAGPLAKISGSDVTFNGNGHKFDGGGPFYWDGLGGNGGVTKPDPMLTLDITGTFENLKVVNSPQRAVSVNGKSSGALTVTGVTVDNSQGAGPNSKSDGKPAGANTDGFDVAGTDITITKSTVINQDDCLAINRGSNIVFSDNSCTGGHGVSVGSISSDVTVSGVQITGNTITDNVQALRIKTKASATGSSVSGVTYSGNKATGCTQFGVIIDQSYPDTLGTPGNGVKVSDINFTGSANTIAVGSDAVRVAVNCGSGSCTGTWDWSDLTVTDGKTSEITGFSGISGGSF